MTKKPLAGSTLLIIIIIITTHGHASAKDCLSTRMSIDSVKQMSRGEREFILIDVRSAKEFELFRIPGSINIPLFAIKTKTILKAKPLVMINEGHRYRQLLEECDALSNFGFTVSVVEGGLYQWKEKGGPLEGDVFAQRELNRIPPQTIFHGRTHENWTLIDVSPSGKSEPGLQNLKVIHLPYSKNLEQFVVGLKAEIRKQKTMPFHSFLIYDEEGTTYEGMEKQIQGAGISNVLYLKGGLEGYRTFEREQINIRQAKDEVKAEKTVKTHKRCATCP